MTPDPHGSHRFRYDGYRIDAGAGELRCDYSLGDRRFTERVRFPDGGDWDAPGVDAAARLVFLLSAVSYYKTAAPPVIDLGDLVTTATERAFLRSFYVDGLGEFAYRNRIDLGDLRIEGPDAAPPTAPGAAPATAQGDPVAGSPGAGGRPLVPFGGGIDSVVTAEWVRRRFPDTALFVVGRRDDRFDAIEDPARVSGLPVRRAEREIDPLVLRSAELGFLNGHVPVTGILSSIAVLRAVLDGRDTVVMSNEWSASSGNLAVGDTVVNHQYSKSLAFEEGFRTVLAGALGAGVGYFSLLRPYSELWVARRFAELGQYHRHFRSCNRAFHIDRAQRLDRWCGRCDKCCFIDLILAPYLPAGELRAVFGGREPLDDLALLGRFRTLVGTADGQKPFECVGDVDECGEALALAACRPDRASSPVLAALVAEMAAAGRALAPAIPGSLRLDGRRLLRPLGRHFIPDDYAPDDLAPGDPAPADPAPGDPADDPADDPAPADLAPNDDAPEDQLV